MSFYVEKAQGHAILVDRGRQHAQRHGLSQSGPMDEYSFLWANQLLGNPLDCAMLEITLGNMVLKAQQDAMIAITGANIPVTVNGVSIANWSSHFVRRGDVINIGFFNGQGTRLYLAVRKGFQAPLLYQSASCVVREQLGGHNHGSLVQAGDKLSFLRHCKKRTRSVSAELQKLPQNITTVKYIPSYQHHKFSSNAVAAFEKTPYTLSPDIDRMGFRLEGEKLATPKAELKSEGIALGSIQISPNGQPMVMMSDRQSIGGYHKIGVVYRTDLGLLAQCAPGQKVQFVQGDLAEAWLHQQMREGFFAI